VRSDEMEAEFLVEIIWLQMLAVAIPVMTEGRK
jgi:hypothetical protein